MAVCHGEDKTSNQVSRYEMIADSQNILLSPLESKKMSSFYDILFLGPTKKTTLDDLSLHASETNYKPEQESNLSVLMMGASALFAVFGTL